MDNTLHTCWYRNEKCPNCLNQIATNGKLGWCVKCDYRVEYVWKDDKEHIKIMNNQVQEVM